MIRPAQLYAHPNALAPEYARFDVANRLILTGHSHQAWPDRALVGHTRAWEDAARWVDQKWDAAQAMAERVRAGFARLPDDRPERIALAASTHDLVVRFLSALPLRERPRLLTTDGEFHTLRRQLARLAEEGIEVVRVPSQPADEITSKLIAALDSRTAAVLVSAVLYENAHLVPGLSEVQRACEGLGTALLVDAYHALNVVPFSLADWGLEGAYVTGGGYKYCQLGEGNCFLRFPPDCELRPVVTGWFAEFELLADAPAGGRVAYPDGPGRFAGATYDPTSHYRAAAVFDFFAENKLTPTLLREVSQHQVGLLMERFDALDADPRLIERDGSVSLAQTGGFLSLRSARAADLGRCLNERGVYVDCRGDRLRMGPAPYLTDLQLRDAVAALGEALASV